MPIVPVIGNHHDGKDSGFEQLLAVYEMRGNLERLPQAAVVVLREIVMAVSRSQLVGELQELIVALDRRVPHLERAEETAIARDAAMLRAQAVKRLAELTDDTAQSIAITSADSTAGRSD